MSLVRTPDPALVGVLLFAALVRIAALVSLGNLPTLHGDEVYYVDKARALLAYGVYPGAFRAPGQSALLAGAFALFGDSLTVARLAQICVSLVTVWVVFDLATQQFSKRAGIAAGVLVALHPTIVSYTHFIWSETLYGALLMTTVWCLERWRRSPRWTWALAAGLALGGSALTRETGLYFLPLAIGWMAFATAREARQHISMSVAAIALGTVVLVVPWIARNAALVDIAAISTNRWRMLALGNSTDAEIAEMRSIARHFHSERSVRREELAREVALRSIWSQQPGWVFYKAHYATARLLNGRTQLARFAKRRWFQPEARTLARRLVVVERIASICFVAAAILGLWLTPAGHLKVLVLLLIGFHWAMYLVTFANPRFAVPLLAPLAIYGGALVSGDAEWRRRAVSARVAAVTSLALYGLVLLCAGRAGDAEAEQAPASLPSDDYSMQGSTPVEML